MTQKRAFSLKSVLLLCFFAQSVFVSAKESDQIDETASGHVSKEIRLRLTSYNVENMFDNLHDLDSSLAHGKEDYTFLPKESEFKQYCNGMTGYYKKECFETDWNDERATWKVQNVAKVINLIPSKPDILVLAEVENENVVGQLARRIGFEDSFVVSDSPDHRGIDVAILYNKKALEFVNSVQVAVVGEALTKPTRNILRAEFKIKGTNGKPIKGSSIFVYANHWPSQAAPSVARMQAAKILRKDIDKLTADYDGTPYFVAMGDFNTIPKDKPHPFNNLLTNSNTWKAALVDSESWARAQVPALEQSLLPGSYWYGTQKAWNKLDHIFVSKNLVNEYGVELIPSSFFILNNKEIMEPSYSRSRDEKTFWIPKRMNTSAETQDDLGFSDHLPIGIDLRVPLK